MKMTKKERKYQLIQKKYAGRHLILEFYGCQKNLDSTKEIKKILLKAAKKCQATILSSKIYHFSPQGISAVVIIKESHLSIHTWPEYNYAAIDLFTCGKVSPEKAIPELKKGFQPKFIQATLIKRGFLKF